MNRFTIQLAICMPAILFTAGCPKKGAGEAADSTAPGSPQVAANTSVEKPALAQSALRPASAEDTWHFSKIDEWDEWEPMADYQGSLIRVDSKGRPMVLYQRDPNRSQGLSQASWDGDAWRICHIEENCSPLRMRFTLDSADTPYVLYSAFNCQVEGLKFASLDAGGAWQTNVVYSKPSPSEEEMMSRFGCKSYSLNLMVNDSNDFAVDDNSGVHLVYADPESERVVYGYRPRDAKNWNWESLEEVGNHRLTVSRIYPVVRVSPAGQVCVVYKRYSQGAGDKMARIELRIATKTGRDWKYRTVVDKLDTSMASLRLCSVKRTSVLLRTPDVPRTTEATHR
jgi:hypothetical protein